MGNAILDRLLKNQCSVLVAWQICPIIVCIAGTNCTLLVNNFGQTIPLFMLAISYFLILIFNVWWWPASDVSWWKYMLIAFCGLAGDWTAILAYNTTSLASAMLLVSTAIFWVAPLSFFAFGRKINWKQFLAILLAAGGISLVIVADGTEGSKWIGNVLALVSGVCYAVSTVTQEKVVNDNSVRLYLFRFSVCAFPLAAILSGSLEWKIIYNYDWNWKSILLVLGYSVLLSLFYSVVPLILQYSNATIMNLSTLTSNFYSLAISIFFFGTNASWLYLVGFICIPIAIAIFVLTETKNHGNPLEIQSIETESLPEQIHYQYQKII